VSSEHPYYIGYPHIVKMRIRFAANPRFKPLS